MISRKSCIRTHLHLHISFRILFSLYPTSDISFRWVHGGHDYFLLKITRKVWKCVGQCLLEKTVLKYEYVPLTDLLIHQMVTYFATQKVEQLARFLSLQKSAAKTRLIFRSEALKKWLQKIPKIHSNYCRASSSIQHVDSVFLFEHNMY